MITFIIGLILMIALVVLAFVMPLSNMKTLIMSGIVMLMLLLTVVDEIVTPKNLVKKVQSSSIFD